MKKFIIFALFLFLSFFHSELIAGNFTNLDEKEGIALLKGDKQFALTMTRYEGMFDANLANKITSGITLKMKMIGKTFCQYEWGKPFINIKIMLGGESNEYFGYVKTAYNKDAMFIKANTFTYAEVWSGETIFMNASIDSIKDMVDDIFDDFLNVYLTANPVKIVEE